MRLEGKMRSFYLLFLLTSFAFAQEGQLKIPFNFENASVLPSGIRNLRYMNAKLDAIDKFDGSGNIVPIGNALNKAITWGDSINGKKDIYERALLRGTLSNYGIDESEYIGNTTGVVNVAVTAQVPVIAYGVNEKLTMAIALPFVTDDISVDSGFVADENLNNFATNIVQRQRNSQHKAYKVKFDTLNAIENKLRDNGYKTLSSSEGRRSRLGDVIIVSKYQYVKSDNLLSALRFEVTAPTGEKTDVDKAVDVGTGDGQWDVGLGVASQYDISGAFSLSGFAGFTIQLPTEGEKRIPVEADSKITEDKDERTEIDLGDMLKIEAALTYNFLNGFSLVNGLGHQYKQADSYEGSKFSKNRYEWLAQDTEQKMTTYQAGLSYSTIPLFRQKKFKVPLQASVFYTSVLEGKNIVKDDVVTLEMALFF